MKALGMITRLERAGCTMDMMVGAFCLNSQRNYSEAGGRGDPIGDRAGQSFWPRRKIGRKIIPIFGSMRVALGLLGLLARKEKIEIPHNAEQQRRQLPLHPPSCNGAEQQSRMILFRIGNDKLVCQVERTTCGAPPRLTPTQNSTPTLL
jgi:hypothetical protein